MIDSVIQTTLLFLTSVALVILITGILFGTRRFLRYERCEHEIWVNEEGGPILVRIGEVYRSPTGTVIFEGYDAIHFFVFMKTYEFLEEDFYRGVRWLPIGNSEYRLTSSELRANVELLNIKNQDEMRFDSLKDESEAHVVVSEVRNH